MYSDNPKFMHRLIALGIVTLALIFLIAIYNSDHGSFTLTSPPSSYAPTLTNPEVLQNWLPAKSYSYTIARISDFLKASGTNASTMAIQGDVTVNESTFDFTIVLEPQNQTHKVSVSVADFNGVISTGTSVDGAPQGNVTPSQVQNPQTGVTTQFSGFGGLLNEGVTSDQANNLQTALQKFAPHAGTFNVDASKSTHNIDPNTGASTYTFAVSIDSKNYSAKLTSPDLSSIDLTLYDTSGNQQIFDSGLVSSTP